MSMAPRDQQPLARVFHALGDPTRLDLLARLQDAEMCVCDLVAAVHMGQSLVSFHLKVLREAGLIAQRRSGRWVYYSIVSDAFGMVGELLATHANGTRTAPRFTEHRWLSS